MRLAGWIERTFEVLFLMGWPVINNVGPERCQLFSRGVGGGLSVVS